MKEVIGKYKQILQLDENARCRDDGDECFGGSILQQLLRKRYGSLVAILQGHQAHSAIRNCFGNIPKIDLHSSLQRTCPWIESQSC